LDVARTGPLVPVSRLGERTEGVERKADANTVRRRARPDAFVNSLVISPNPSGDAQDLRQMELYG